MSRLFQLNQTSFRVLSASLALCLLSLSMAHAAPRKRRPPQPNVPVLPVLPVNPPAPPAPRPTPATDSAPTVIATPQVTDEAILYQGLPLPQSGIDLKSWGSGTAQESSKLSLLNHHAIRVTTLDYYQGARILFTKPVALPAPEAGKNHVLVLTIRFPHGNSDSALLPTVTPERAHTADWTSDPSSGKARLQLAQSGPRRNGGRRRFPGNFPPGPGQSATRPGTPVPTDDSGDTFPLKTLRLVFTLANGATTEILRTIPQPDQIEFGNVDTWVGIGVPLQILKFPAGTAPSPLQSVTVTGETFATFYIGQIKIVNDETPITASAGDSQDVASGDDVALKATAGGGLSMLNYSWDFDASDGITEDKTGPEVTTKYSQGDKEYKITLTVSDADGIKPPVTTTTTVHVEP